MHNKNPKRKRKIPKGRASTGWNKFSLADFLKDMMLCSAVISTAPPFGRFFCRFFFFICSRWKPASAPMAG